MCQASPRSSPRMSSLHPPSTPVMEVPSLPPSHRPRGGCPGSFHSWLSFHSGEELGLEPGSCSRCCTHSLSATGRGCWKWVSRLPRGTWVVLASRKARAKVQRLTGTLFGPGLGPVECWGIPERPEHHSSCDARGVPLTPTGSAGHSYHAEPVSGPCC